MSQENVDYVRRALEAFNRRDIEGLVEMLDPEVDWQVPTEVPGASTYHGHDGVRRAVAEMLDTFAGLQADPERFIDAGDRVVVLYYWRGSGSASGVPVDALDVQVAVVTAFRNGKAVRVQFYVSWEQALKAAGLSE
jgi:ketosteroid isomerase-like protein